MSDLSVSIDALFFAVALTLCLVAFLAVVVLRR